jgi:uncharacterized repeat protein (TIGR03803 family)
MRKVLPIALLLVSFVTATFGQTYKVLWSFGGSPDDGQNPVGNLIVDTSGNLYGTTVSGGNDPQPEGCAPLGCGTVFMLSPNGNGTWSETTIYKFCSDISNFLCLDGSFPQAGLVLDSMGNLYGTTPGGGICNNSPGCGVVFELSPPAFPGGAWTEDTLYSFCAIGVHCSDGANPYGQLIFDAAGNLYGTTSEGGTGTSGSYGGTVFELSPNGIGTWTETVLYNFCANGHNDHCTDGTLPKAGVTFDAVGSLYGTTALGGTPKGGGAGTVYKLSPGANGWTESVLLYYEPAGKFGVPLAAVTFDKFGNLYSTVSSGVVYFGGVFKLTAANHLSHTLGFTGLNGATPTSSVLVTPSGSAIYGTTTLDSKYDAGLVFKIGGGGKQTTLYNFCQQPNCADGQSPFGGLISDSANNLYGTTKEGGANGLGVVFEITP